MILHLAKMNVVGHLSWVKRSKKLSILPKLIKTKPNKSDLNAGESSCGDAMCNDWAL